MTHLLFHKGLVESISEQQRRLNDHTLDALRYALYPHPPLSRWARFKLWWRYEFTDTLERLSPWISGAALVISIVALVE